MPERESEPSAPTTVPPYSRDGHPPLDPDAKTGAHQPQRSWQRWPVMIATVLFVAIQAGPWILGTVGRWLVVEDEIGQADAIFVHDGDFPFREMEAAELYSQGLAPEVWIARVRPTDRSRALERLGVRMPGSEYWRGQVLQRLGVPASAIRLLDEPVRNTRDEIETVRNEMGRLDRLGVILVTSKAHSRRVGTLWRQANDSTLEGAVRWSRSDPFDPDRWWTNTTDGEAVVNELVGLLDAWVGAGWRPERD